MLQQNLDTEAVVHVNTIPSSRSGACIDESAVPLVLVGNLRPVTQRLCVSRRNTVDRRPIGPNESQRPVVEDMN